GLVDDRWVAHDSPASNARLIRETLLCANSSIVFQPLPTSSQSTEDDARLANETFALKPDAACTAVFGMGKDGHIASLIPGSDGFAAAVHSSDVYVAIHAPDSSVAAPWPDRISLSRAGFARAQRHILLVRGDEKRALLERALEGDDVAELPVRLLLQESILLDVYWCP
ncbi:MAG: 6-phosphogluconolactonase, partial [Lysobacteraceae bacterium]